MSDHTRNELAAAAQRADVVVVGAATTYELAKRDLNVVVIDRNDVGHGCSFGNAGWITPAFAVPLPVPGLLFKSLKWMCDPNSPPPVHPRTHNVCTSPPNSKTQERQTGCDDTTITDIVHRLHTGAFQQVAQPGIQTHPPPLDRQETMPHVG